MLRVLLLGLQSKLKIATLLYKSQVFFLHFKISNFLHIL